MKTTSQKSVLTLQSNQMKTSYSKIVFFAALGFASVVFSSCGKDEFQPSYGNEEVKSESTIKSAEITAGDNVEINGVTWATCNVGANAPQEPGIQYNMEVENAPVPAGYRLPNADEMLSLFDTENVSNEWTTVNGVNGRKFTDNATGNSIFFPATDEYSSYLSSTIHQYNPNGVFVMNFSRAAAVVTHDYFAEGHAIRCVQE